MTRLIDTHAHLQDEAFAPDLPQVRERAENAGIAAVINVGTDLETSRQAIKLAENNRGFWALVGFHPHDAKLWNENSKAELCDLLEDAHVLGIGEIGLDYHYDYSPREIQQKVFKEQWRLAAELDLPVVIHVREAFEDFFSIIKNEPSPKRRLLHCFSGDTKTALQALDAGFSFSIGGVLTYPKSEETREVFRLLPQHHIHLETDCPYLAPAPLRGKRNEPSMLIHVFNKMCEIRHAASEPFAAALQENALRFFAPKFTI